MRAHGVQTKKLETILISGYKEKFSIVIGCCRFQHLYSRHIRKALFLNDGSIMPIYAPKYKDNFSMEMFPDWNCGFIFKFKTDSTN